MQGRAVVLGVVQLSDDVAPAPEGQVPYICTANVDPTIAVPDAYARWLLRMRMVSDSGVGGGVGARVGA